MSLRDLEQIQYEVSDARSRELIAEVVRCYESGAYRAALVSLWIAVVADLTSKIRYLAESGDNKAKKIIDDLDEALTNKVVHKVQEYEREILRTAEEGLEILLPRERVELSRLNEDRNLCAHPGYVDGTELFVPDAEVVRAHLVAANRAVFSQRPMAGKRLLATLGVEVEGNSWPSDGDYFLRRFFWAARDSVKVNMTKVLIKHSLRPPADNKLVAERSLNAAFVIAVDSPLLFEDSLQAVLQAWEESGALGDSELIRATGAYGAKSVLWTALPGTGKSRLVALLERCSLEMLLDNGFFKCGAPKDKHIATIFSAFVSKLNPEQAQRAIRESMDRRPFVPTVIQRVGSSASFRNAEENLRLVELCSESLELGDVVSLRQAIQTNPRDQVRLAGESEAILSSIYSASSPTEASIAEWRALATWLHEQGLEKNDDYYLYEDLLDLVSEND